MYIYIFYWYCNIVLLERHLTVFVRSERTFIFWKVSSIHFGAYNLATANGGIIQIRAGVLRILKSRKLSTEVEQYIARSAFTVLGNDDLRHAMKVSSVFVLIDMIVFGTVNKKHHVGILLDGSRLAKVAELRSFSLKTFA